MRIAVNTRFLITNKLEGIGFFTFESMRRIVHSHPEIDFYFLFDRIYSEEFVFAKNVIPVVLFPPARHTLLWLWWFEISVAHWLNKNNPDLFLSPDGYGCLHTDVRQVIVMHDLAYEHFSDHIPIIARAYYRYFMPRFAKKAIRVATVSEFSKSDIVKHYHILPELIDVVYSGPKEVYKPIDVERKRNVKKKYSDGKEYFLYVGSIHPRKNIAKLLESFDQFKKETNSDCKLIIVGRKVWDSTNINKIYMEMKHKNDILFAGYVGTQELAEITASASAMIFVSLFEGFGVPIIEAMNCEVPVITSNTTSMIEIAGGAAILVNPTSVDEISFALKTIMSNETLRQTLIEKGIIQAKKFSWNLTADKLWTCCEKVIMGK